MTDEGRNDEAIFLTADIVSAYVSKNPLPPTELPALISDVHKSLCNLTSRESGTPTEPLKPAVSVKKSVQNDHIVCLEDGKKFTYGRRQLRPAPKSAKLIIGSSRRTSNYEIGCKSFNLDLSDTVKDGQAVARQRSIARETGCTWCRLRPLAGP